MRDLDLIHSINNITENNVFMKKLIFNLITATLVLAGCGTETYLVYSPGENLTSLTKVHESKYKCEYPFGGDNGKNLFFSIRDNENDVFSNICRKDNPIGMSVIQLTGGNNQNTRPSYSAATNMVAFQNSPEGRGCKDIYMVSATKGGALQQVTNTPDYNEADPCLSRDGKKIVYERRRYDAPLHTTEIWVKDLQTNENMQLGLGRTPCFSPDGRTIAYVKYANDELTTYLCVINIDGTALTQLTDKSKGSVWNPCFSPDGKHIVFQCRTAQKDDYDLYVTDRSGNNLIQLTVNKSYDGEPYWANDGNIYFTSDRGASNEQYQIWRFRYGQQVYAPVRETRKETATPTQHLEPYNKGTVYHTVSGEETITKIAKKYGITVRDVVKWNNLTTMTLVPGMKLKVSAQ